MEQRVTRTGLVLGGVILAVVAASFISPALANNSSRPQGSGYIIRSYVNNGENGTGACGNTEACLYEAAAFNNHRNCNTQPATCTVVHIQGADTSWVGLGACCEFNDQTSSIANNNNNKDLRASTGGGPDFNGPMLCTNTNGAHSDLTNLSHPNGGSWNDKISGARFIDGNCN